jgi:hypothetical protein
MPFRPPGPRRERILAMGSAGSGKTRMWMSIAKRYEQLKTPGTFYVLDTDMAVPVMLGGDTFASLADRTQWLDYEPSLSGTGKWVPRGEVIENPRLVVMEPWEWPEYVDASAHIKAHQTNDDWAVSDLHNPAWSAVQDYYIDLIFKKDAVDFYTEARVANKKGGALDGDKDWSVINRMYKEFMTPFVRSRGHLFICTGTKGVQTEGGRVDAKEVRVTYGAHGVKPEGQKMTDHLVNTVIFAKEFTPRVWTWTTVKDREREPMVGTPANDFAMDYLVKIAGWKLA